MAKAIIDYIPKTKREAIRDAYRDSDGYWICLNEGWEATRTDSGCRTIHEDTIADLKYQIAGIQKVEAPIRDADGNELTTDEAEAIQAEMTKAFYEQVTGETLPAVVAPAPVAVIGKPEPKRHTEPADSWRDMEPRLIWTLPAIPYMFAWWAVIAALVGVKALGLAVEGVEKSVHLARNMVKFLSIWWKQSTGFRAELLRECRLSDWEVA